jgi:lysophospholipase L1-like esterase
VTGGASALPSQVFEEGDSLSVDSAAMFKADLAPSSAIVDAKIGRHTYEGVTRIAKQKTLPGAVVVALGTNDDFDAQGIVNYRVHVGRIMSMLGPYRCVVWINSFQKRTAKQIKKHSPMIFSGLNKVLLDMARRTPNVLLIDWATMSANHPEWYVYDSVHPTDVGYRARARVTVDTLSKCRYVPPPAPPVTIA